MLRSLTFHRPAVTRVLNFISSIHQNSLAVPNIWQLPRILRISLHIAYADSIRPRFKLMKAFHDPSCHMVFRCSLNQIGMYHRASVVGFALDAELPTDAVSIIPISYYGRMTHVPILLSKLSPTSSMRSVPDTE